MGWQSIVTKNAIIDGTYTLIKDHSKYFLPRDFLFDVSVDDSVVIRTVYRRFLRLSPLISQRKMVRETYIDYLRYKFKNENYALKRSILFEKSPQSSLRDDLGNSLTFFIKSTCYLPETKVRKYEMARDNTICRQIVKNIMTMEYQKQDQINKARGKNNDVYSKLRTTFDHIKSPYSSPNFMVIGEFERYILYLNELLHTRL